MRNDLFDKHRHCGKQHNKLFDPNNASQIVSYFLLLFIQAFFVEPVLLSFIAANLE